ncbi:hypothetical protein KGM_207269 [Danaus plexippus plexippus]|uniref:Uncharacterized protein n=1 Tax=Danaus plexippus plexippus TaxID=278856 RepID=A0A212EUM4_DANPL|nr:uncharacterized protein LOC116772638 isoform X1 [Danaus plexippus plexippus]XP_032520770.1 uncharacterized protein LOC116772638 isoform X2 [Danaus plexippus plexippus]OWR45161.1 hypothetical protein KGM_207269 [Danaus plexippus plexippus]
MEWFSTADGKYRIESLSSITFPGALEVIRTAFCQDEYVSIGSEVNKNPKAAEELLELCADAALDGVSLVGVNVETGEVAAVAFNKIQVKANDASEKPFFVIFSEERCTQASSRSLIEFMADVDERCNLFEKYKVDCSLEIMFLATLRNYRGQGLGKLLTKYSIEVARKYKYGPIAPLCPKDLGPKYSNLTSRKPINTYPKICQAIWTGRASQNVGKAHSFTVHLTVPFSEFVFNGKTYSERIGDVSSFCEVAALSL